TQFCRKLAAERPLKDIRDEYNYPKKKGIKDECSRLLEASTMKSRRGFAIQRLMNAMRQAHADGGFIVFDTLTLADDRLEAFYDNPNAPERKTSFIEISRGGKLPYKTGSPAISVSQSTFSVKVLNLFSRSRRKTNKRKSKHSAMLRNKETRHRMFIGLLNTTRKLA